MLERMRKIALNASDFSGCQRTEQTAFTFSFASQKNENRKNKKKFNFKMSSKFKLNTKI